MLTVDCEKYAHQYLGKINENIDFLAPGPCILKDSSKIVLNSEPNHRVFSPAPCILKDARKIGFIEPTPHVFFSNALCFKRFEQESITFCSPTPCILKGLRKTVCQ